MKIQLMIGSTIFDTVDLPTAEMAPCCLTSTEGPAGKLDLVWGRSPEAAYIYHLVNIIPHYNSEWLREKAPFLTPGVVGVKDEQDAGT